MSGYSRGEGVRLLAICNIIDVILTSDGKELYCVLSVSESDG